MEMLKGIVGLGLCLGVGMVPAQATDLAVGKVNIGGGDSTVYLTYDAQGNPKHYFKNSDGRFQDYYAFDSLKRAEERARYGKFSVQLYDKLNSMSPNDSIEVLVEPQIKVPSIRGRKPTKSEFAEVAESARRKLARRITDTGLKSREKAKPLGRTTFEVKAAKKDLLRLKHDADIASILPAVQAHSPVRTFLSNAFKTSNRSKGALSISNLAASGGNGAGVTVAVVDPFPLPGSVSVGTWFNYPKTFRSPANPYPSASHGLYTMATVRNTYSSDTLNFKTGGSYKLSHMIFAPFDSLENHEGIGAYEWLLNQNPLPSVASNSWGYARWLGGAIGDQNQMDRYADMKAAQSPFLFIVAAAGNSGYPSALNDTCRAALGNYNWTRDTCEQVIWSAHNVLSVGACTSSTVMAPFSSWRNQGNQDEQPHVVARGWGITYPDNSVHYGTSLSAPAIAALGANLISKYPALDGYPEQLKAIIMASAAPNNLGTSYKPNQDTRSGFGLPEGTMASQLAANNYGLASSYPVNYSAPEKRRGTANFIYDEYQTDPVITRTLVMDSPAGYVHVLATWMSDPEGSCTAGLPCAADNIDLRIFNSSGQELGAGQGTSLKNTTERVQFYVGSGVKTLTIQLRRVNWVTQRDIWGALAWTVSGSQIP